MSFGRKAIIWFLSSILVLLLFSLAVDVGFIRIVGQPQDVENILDKSGVYSSVVPGLLEEAKTINANNEQIPLTDPIVKAAATSTLTPQFLRTNVNQALGSIYQWLDGTTNQPKFNINLNDVKTQLADKVAAGAKQRATALPVCTTLPVSSSFDAFNATCLPRGVTADQVAVQVRSDILGGQGFLDNTNIQASDVKTSGSKQSVFDGSLKKLPSYFKQFKRSPFILLALSVVIALVTAYIYRPKLRGLRHIGFILGGTGIFVILFGLGVNEAVSNKITPHINLSNSVFQVSLRAVIRDLAHDLRSSYILIGVIYLAIGAIAVGAAYYLQKRQPAAQTAPPEPAEAKPAPATKNPPKKIDVK